MAGTPAGLPQAPAALQAQIDSFEQLLNVQVTIYDFAGFFLLGGRRLTADHHHAHDRCAFCRIVKDDLGRMRDCLRCDMAPVVARATGPAAWRRCYAGVWEVVYPLWDGASFIGSLMVGCFRKAGEQPTIEIVAPGSAPRSNSPGGRGRQDQAVFSAGVQLRQRHRLLRDLESDLENRLPALVENFAQGLVRTVLQLRRSDATAGAEETGAGAGGVSSRQERIRAAELFFRTHLAQGVKIGDLARYLHLSVARTSQILRRDMKSTFPAQLRRVRLDEARRLLAVSVLPVGRIAELVGFTDRNYFCRVFTQDAGLTPSAYRKQNARPLRV